MYTKGQREQERNHSFLKIVKISNHCIRARERERSNEGSEDAYPCGGNVGTEAKTEGQGVL